MCTRQVKFFAPTGVGLYEFRVFDGEYHSPEDGEDEIEPDVIGRGALLRVDVSVTKVLILLSSTVREMFNLFLS